ncbi:MAG: hypothetical protein H6635_10445 [Anaerolineales bacterium]|nr:hypothetical protein [Anaerolineales bacterium]MCB9145780.1 hypothetical protein [Anaerolineales bacterium]
MPDRTKKKTKLDIDQMLQNEFNYITQTAFQANEDRSRYTSFFLVSTGSLVAAIAGTQMEIDTKAVSLAFSILFLVLTLMGALTLSQLARLRHAWLESVKAMNKIKEFYIKNHPEIKDAFLWRAANAPASNKPGSISNLTATEVILLSSLTAGAGLYFLLSFFSNEPSWLIWVVVSGGTFFSGITLWFHYVRKLNSKE